MSLDALLLGLPGKIRKLRGNDAPKTPLHVPESIYEKGYPNYDRYYVSCPLYSASLTKLGTNNTVVASHEVLNLSGKGAVNGVWVNSLTDGNTVAGTAIQRWGLEILVDGTDITPPGWVHTVSDVFSVDGGLYCRTSPAIGGVQSNITAHAAATGYALITISHVMVPASVPIPFDSSLVVNFIHLESNSTSTYYTNTCWVNAWLTE
jgi:hypothetical protein